MSSSQKKISIVVPLYKVVSYFKKCLDSITRQTYADIEILMTDDGSPDESGVLADELVMQDERAAVVHQQNRWLGGARNTGIRLATGKYLLFVDSDDYIRMDTCEKLLSVMEKTAVDMVLFDVQHVDGNDRFLHVSSPDIETHRVIAGAEAAAVLYDRIIATHTINNAVMKLYRTSVFQRYQLFFDETIRYAEDYEFCLRLYPYIQSFVHDPEPFYYYRYNDQSIMHSADPQIVDKFILLYRHRENFMVQYGWDSKEYRQKSAVLLITMIAKCLPKYLGRRNCRDSMRHIRRLYHKKELYEAMGRIKVEDIPLGGVGRLAVYGIRYRLGWLILAASKRLEKSEGVYR